MRIAVHFALVDEALLALVDEFDRIFDRQDVLIAIVVDEVDHRSHRRALARSGRAGDEHETTRRHRHVFEDLAHAEVFHRQHLRRNRSEHRTRAAVLIERIHAKARDARHLEREVGLENSSKSLRCLSFMIS